MSKNIEITNNGNLIETNDDLLNQIIRATEKETGANLAMAIPAISFDEVDDEEKIYIVLLKFYDNDVKDWSVRVGRQTVYNYLKFLTKEEQIDPNESFIISCDHDETVTGKEDVKPSTKPITVFRFLKVMLENKKVTDDDSDFDINEFDHFDYKNGDKTILEI